MARSNIDVTIFILDAGLSVSEKAKDDISSFFEKSQSCLSRIVERLIFSKPNDLLGLVIMGSYQTNNTLASGSDSYQNINTAINLTVPTWDFIDVVRDQIKPSKFDTDWIDAIMVAADFLESELGSKKVAHKKIVLMTDLKTCPDANSDRIQEIIKIFKESTYELIVIGPDIWLEENESEPLEMILSKSKQLQESELLLKNLISNIDVISCTFEEAIYQLLFHKKKVTRPQPWNVDMCIGPNIAIPVSGFSKIRDDKTITSWKKVFRDPTTQKSSTTEAIMTKKSYFKMDNNTVYVDELDIVQGYLYGQTIVPYTKLDKAMEYNSGPRCLTIYGFTKEVNIHWNNLVGDGITYVVPRKGDDNAAVAMDAFITNLKDLNLVAVARKVYNKGNAPHMCVLFPIIESNCKFLAMIALAFKDDYRHMSFPSLNKTKFAYNSEQSAAIDSLIDAMDLTEFNEDGKELFSIDNCVNPALQHFFDTLAYRARNPKDPLPPPRPEVLDLMQVPPIVDKLAKEPIENIKKNFELITKEKPQSGKHWINMQLKTENNTSDDTTAEPIETITNPPTALSVMLSQVTHIGTVDPTEDFKTLLGRGEPFDTVAEQMFEVIERLALLTLGNNYTKPLSALQVLREESVVTDPLKYNTWLNELKNNLLARSRKIFLTLLIEKKLGPITDKENPLSSVTEDVAKTFGAVPHQAIEPENMDTSELDSLFDDDD